MKKRRADPKITQFDLDIDKNANDMFADADSHSQDHRHDNYYRGRGRGGDKTMVYGLVFFIIAALGAAAYVGWKEKWIFSGKPPVVSTDPVKPVISTGSGSMNVISKPEGATVYIDGRKVGETPYHATTLKAGSYSLRLELKGRLNWTGDVDIKGGELKQVNAKMRSSLFKFAINSNALHAEYQILNIRKKFQQGMLLEPGQYKVKAWAPGYKSRIKTFVVFNKNQTISVSLTEATHFAPLKVKIDPPQATDLAKIKLVHWPDSFKQGLKVSEGTYTLQVKAEAYRTAKKRFKMGKSGQTVTVKLRSGGVRMTVRTKPTSAKVKILTGSYTYKHGVKVMPGKYTIAISAKGFRTRKQTVMITSNETFKFNLKEDVYRLIVKATPRKARIKFIAPGNLSYSSKTKYPPGNYKVQITLNGYKTVTKTVKLKGKDRTLNIRLAKLAFPLRLTVKPRRARVKFLNKKYRYKSGMRVAPGKYHIAVSHKGFRTKRIWIEVTDKAIRQNINLGEDKYILSVNVQPSSAQVRIVTPGVNWKPGIKLKPGRYELDVRAPGYKPRKQTVTIKDQDVNLTFKLGEEIYALTVNTTPQNGTVKIIDYPAPYEPGMKLIPGRYQVEVSLKGYAPVQQWVTIVDKDESIFVILKERLYTLTVATNPSTAKIELVNYQKEYHAGMELPAGRYEVKVSLKNYKTVSKSILLKENANFKISMSYKTVLKSGMAGEPTMIVVPKGRYQMGSLDREYGRSSNEGPEHTVVLVKPFALSRTEVTFSQYDVFAKITNRSLPSDNGWGRGKRPVINVSWNDAQAYVRWLSQKTGKKYRLPSEAEWEYGARARGRKPFNTGLCLTTRQANVDGDYAYRGCLKGINRGKTVPAKSFAANKFKLHDMHGNVAEWTLDCWSSSHRGAPQSGRARTDGRCSKRVIKGGAWDSIPRDARSASRKSKSVTSKKSTIGFRILRVL